MKSHVSNTATSGCGTGCVVFNEYSPSSARDATSLSPKTPSSDTLHSPDPKLAAGKKLPVHIKESFPAKTLAGKPLVDIDSYYARKLSTFITIASDGTIFRFNSGASFYLLSPNNPLRRVTVYILTHPVFSFLVLSAILVNCVFMAMNSNNSTVEYTFTAIYTCEAIIKALARGVIVGEFTYLRDAWNWLDFIVIGLAYLMFVVPSLGNLSALRSLRVLRTLKTVTAVPGLKTIVSALMEAVKQLRDVMILTLFVLSICALIGLQLYRGTLLAKCVIKFNATRDVPLWILENTTRILRDGQNLSLIDLKQEEFENDPHNWKSSPEVCMMDDESTCGEGYHCVRTRTGNPNYNYTNFDNFGYALLCAFRLMTQDYWENLYQLIIKANGIIHVCYFVFVIFFGSFYLVNLILAIVAMSYAEISRRDKAELEAALEETENWQEEDLDAEQTCERSHAQNYSTTMSSILMAANCTVLVPSIRDHSREDLLLDCHNSPTRLSHCPNTSLTDCLSPTKTIIRSDSYPQMRQSRGSHPPTGITVLPLPSRPAFPVEHCARFRDIPYADETKPPSIISSSRTTPCLSRIREGVVIHSPNRAKIPQQLSPIHGNMDFLALPECVSALQQVSRVGSFSISTAGGPEHLSTPRRLGLTDLVRSESRRKELAALVKVTLRRKLQEASLCQCCPQGYARFRAWIALVALDPFTELFITLCIVTNTAFIAIDMPGISQEMETFLKDGNIFFTVTFGLESVLKIIAMNPKGYFADGWNIFDFVNVVLSLVEIPLAEVELSILRSFRLLRVFKLAKSWKTMNLLFAIIARTLGALGNLTLVLIIIIFIFAVVGMSLFGENYKQFQDPARFPKMEGTIPRWNFCDFIHSFMIVFRVLCGEWIESMWDCMLVNGSLCIPFFLLTKVLGNLVVLNLFLALLLSSFGSESLQRREDDVEETNKLQEAIDRIHRGITWLGIQVKKFKTMLMTRLSPLIQSLKIKRKPIQETNFYTPSTSGFQESSDSAFEEGDPMECTMRHILQPYEASRVPILHEVDIVYCDSPPDCCSQRLQRPCEKCIAACMRCAVGKVFWKLRCYAYLLVEHRYFEMFILVMIGLSSMSLTLEDKYLPTRPTLKMVLEIMDKAFTVIFTLEMLVKWLAMGYNRYFRDPWCWLDFLIVLISLISLIVNLVNGDASSNMGAFRAMRTLRALRPLRAVSRWQGMKIVVNALFQAIPSIFNVLLVCLVFWLIFSIMAMQLFGGKFYKCKTEPQGEVLLSRDYPNKTICLQHQAAFGNVTWVNSRINFDNVLNGYLALLQIATFKGWIEIMADAVDATKKDLQPIYNNAVHNYFFFVFFIVFGSFFTLNLFIGVIIDNFNVQKKRVGGSVEIFMTDDQKKYYNAMKKMSNVALQKPIPKPRNCVSLWVFRVVQNEKFDMMIMVVILLNTLFMCLEHHNQPYKFKLALELINKIFIVLFTGEFVLKLMAQRWYYFKYPWNLFDFVIVAFSIVCWAFESVFENIPVSPTLVRVIRIFRIGRVLRLVKSARGIRTLLFSLIVSLPALFNIGLLLLMVLFIYAIIGMSLFNNVTHYAGIDATFNFETFPQAMVVLFQMATSAGWNGVLEGLMNDEGKPQCPPQRSNCGNYALAVVYLCSYLVVSFLVIINMYIAVILENFSQATDDVQQGLTQDDFDLFYEFWERYDPTASGYIPLASMYQLVGEIGPPLGIPTPNKLRLALLAIPIYEGGVVACLDLLDALTKHFLSRTASSTEEEGGDDVKSDDEEEPSSAVPPAPPTVVVAKIDLPEDAKNRVNKNESLLIEQKPKVGNTYEYLRREIAARTITRWWRTVGTARKADGHLL